MGCPVVGVAEDEGVWSELEESDCGDSGLMSPYAITRFLSCP